MKRVFKSGLSLVLALTIVLSSALVGLGEIDFGSIFAVKVSAASVDDLRFILNDDGVSYFVNDCYENVSGELVIPDTYNGLPVTRIGDAAFYNCRGLISVTIPDSITSIGDGAFTHTLYYNTPSNWVDGVLYIGNHLIEAKDTINGDYLIKNGTKTIAERAFYYCKNLNSITIPDSVTSIGAYAFQGCTSLTSLKIGKSVTSIGNWAIDGTGYYKDTANWENDVLYIGNYLIDANTTISGDYIIKNGTKAIADSAFGGCDNLTSVTIPDSVTSIGVRAFSNCYGLTSITIPDSVTSIGTRAFSNCYGLTSINVDENNAYYLSDNGVLFNKNKTFLIQYPASKSDTKYTIPISVTRISDCAFKWCRSLTSITIPGSVTNIGDDALYGCSSLTSITIPDSVTNIGEYAFYGCTSLTSVNISNRVTSIDSYAFCGCTCLASVTIPDSVTSIHSSAFERCTSLTFVSIPGGVTSIGYGTFYNCKNLTTVTIPDSVTNIGDEAFDFCGKIKHVYYQGSKEQWKDISIGSYNGYLTRANIHYNSDKTSVNAEIVSSKGITFSLYNKQAWAESETFSASAKAAIKNATVEYNGKQTNLSSNSFLVNKSNLSYNITVTAPNFQKYIIPAVVGKSWADNSVESFPAYMTKDKKDGKTYISTVFARNCSESGKKTTGYIDVTTGSLNLLNGVNTDIIVTAVEQNSPVKEYWLSQDELHKISDSDGVFSSVDLYSKFDENKPVYAYAVLENGQTTVAVSVSLKKVVMSSSAVTFLNTLNSGKVNFLGEDGFKVTLSDSIPLVGGASVSAGMASLPVGVEIENERVRISIGVDIFKNEINGKDDTTYLWENFKDSCKSINKSVDEATDKMETYRNLVTAHGFGTVKQEASKKKNFDCSFLGYIEAYIIDGEIVFKEVSGTVALEFFFNYKQQFLVAGIPAIYAYVKAGAEASASATGGRAIPDNNFPIELDVEANLTPSVKIGGGVGIKDAISAGIWGKGSLPVGYNFTDTHLTLGLKGEFGLEAEFFVLKGDVTLLDGSLNLIDHYFKNPSSAQSLKEDANTYYSVNKPDVLRDGKISLADRSYLENTSDWLGGQSISRYGLRRTITPESVAVSNLQTSVYKNSQTQLVQFGDTMLMAWIEDCADRDAYNRMRLVYSVYNTETGAWNEPRAVDDNGKCDAAPSLATDGENVYIAWQNIDYTVSTADSETVDILMKNAEIRIAKFNASTGNFENVKTVTDNSTYDYAPKVTVNNGVAEVYWANSSSLDFAKGTVSILKSDFNGTTSTVLSGLNYVHSLDSNGTDISYAMDKDGDTSTTTDVKVYTNSEQVSVDYEGVETSCLCATYAMLDGKKTLFYVDDYNICYIQNGEEKVVFESPRSVNGNLQICSNGTKTTAMWLEAGEMGTELYTCSYENGKWSAPVQLTSFSKVLSNVSVTYFDGKIYGLFNRTHLESVTSEVDGSTYYKNGETDLCQLTTEGFTDISLSLIEIDESQFVPSENSTFTVLVNNNGTEKVTDISFEITDGNGYSQTIEKTVDLASGESKFVELAYTVPETISQTELSVYAGVNNDVNEEDNTVSENIGFADLSMGDLKVKYVGGKYIVSGIVTNNNNVAARKVWVNAYLGEVTDNNLFTHYIDVIEPKSSYAVEFVLDSSLLDFKENTSYDVTINVSCDGTERILSNNESVSVVTESNIHVHNYGDWIIDKKATCTEDGSKHIECTVCGEVLETGTIAKTGHKSSDWITDKNATVDSVGSKHKECTVCKAVLEKATISQLKCAAPKLTKVESTGSGVKVTWSKTAGADSYIVYRKTYSNGKWSGWSAIKSGISSSATTYTDTTAKSGVYYIYTVRAKNEAGLGSFDSTGLKIKFLSTPKLSSVANGSGKVTVKWSKVAGASSYTVYRKTYSNGKWSSWSKIGTTKNTYYNDTKVSSGKNYKYTVRATSGDYSSYFNTSGLKIKYLAVVSLKSATSQKAGVKVTWGKVTGAKGYEVYRRTYSKGKWSGWTKIKTISSGSTVSYTDKTAKKGVTYKYTVRAISDSNKGSYNTSGLQVKDKY